ncbi:mRNA CAPPING ENZYME ALPHA SUBUNIT [Encephalitozoon cuniculi GB-M1]|uniref:mRNA guanylyltransferase n=2 Tax=Encephalitozoon cuniculi TaxID=6035 RepID=Q8SQP7_ENCCU|nr:mRNA guanylyltransferase [Encephalitozoon cuniculi GB-M1]KMV65520.1 mRNA capping enzyme subunit alpha [Encephalitozoon cuniculi EcunIII-L]UYI26719.1 mRNA capping enzyme subunit alpha [Encephalitozoon cuniculi]CAD27012.1 mRNA CAPPING ENZYME ALPHA SUBUNIT [Encephalitozoon cuniculi GB-M1]
MELFRLGNKVPPDIAEALRTKIYEELCITEPRSRERFVGCHPVTLTLDNIGLLLNNDFLVCEKSDGVRALLLVTEEMGAFRGYFYDRRNDFYELHTSFPFCSTVLVDGEVLLEDGTVATYAIFDCLIYEGVPQIAKNLYKRLGYAQMFVERMEKSMERTKTLQKEDEDGRERKRVSIEIDSGESSRIHFYVKQMLKSYGFWEIYKKIPELKHGNDGLIFTPADEPYSVGKRGAILKWKPASLNTIDFRAVKHKKWSRVYNLVCSGKRGKDVVFDCFFCSGEEIDGKICEFLYDCDGYYWDLDELVLKKGGWKLYKIRTDKDTPNNIRVVCNILESLRDNLTIEKLSTFYSVMRENSKRREKMRR